MKVLSKDIFISVALVICIILAILLYFKLESSNKCEEIIINKNQEESIQVTVEIAGAVKSPGVYRLKNGSSVEDLINLAGDLTKQANKQYVMKSINRARRLMDGDKIYIPNLSEAEYLISNTDSTKTIDQKVGKSLININTASKESLMSLDGIGASYAKRIVEGRPYKRIEDIKQIKGIGDSTYNKIKDSITI